MNIFERRLISIVINNKNNFYDKIFLKLKKNNINITNSINITNIY